MVHYGTLRPGQAWRNPHLISISTTSRWEHAATSQTASITSTSSVEPHFEPLLHNYTRGVVINIVEVMT